MRLNNLRIRLVRYYHEKGLVNTLLYTLLKLQRLFTDNKYVMFYADMNRLNYDLSKRKNSTVNVECKKAISDLNANELQSLFNARDQRIVDSQYADRFFRGAWLWLVKIETEVAGFVWTIKQHPIEPYFIVLGENDVHFFDNEIFAKFRGQGINPILINYAVEELKAKGISRAYIETRWWNTAEIKSLAKTYFKKIAVVRKCHFLGKSITFWYSQTN